MDTNSIKSPLFAMIDGRFARIDIHVRDLGPQDAMVQKMAADLPTNMLQAFMLPGDRPAHIQTKSGSIIVWTEIKRLKLATIWTMMRDGSRFPLFKPKAGEPPEFEATMEWDPLMAGMRLFFASVYQFTGGQYVWQVSYLLGKAPKRKEIFRPPLPNIFSDARLCMGNDYQHTGKCLADAFLHNLNHLETSRWNDHAMEGLAGEHIKSLYTFDKDDKQVAPPKDYKWFENPATRPVNNNNYGELPLV